MATGYQEAVEKTIIASEQLNQIINGTATAEVVVEDGSKIPSIRKSLVDNFYFKDPISWQQGQTETVFNQLRKFSDGSWWYAPNATVSNPVSMGLTPIGDPSWKIYSLDVIPKLTPQIREALRRTLFDAGYNMVQGSFEEGGILQTSTDVLLHAESGISYKWGGALPKVVPSNSLPLPVSSTEWISVASSSIRTQLSQESGASLVGFKKRDVQNKLSDTAHVKDFGAVGDGTLHTLAEVFNTLAEAQVVYPHATNLSDSLDWAAIQSACLNSYSNIIDFSGGHYICNGKDIVRNGDTELRGATGTVVDMGGGEFLVTGEITQLPNLSSSITTASSSLTLASPASVSAGDVVCVYNPTDYSWSQHRAYYRAGEFYKVRAVSGNTISIYGRPRDAYSMGSVQVFLFKKTSVKINNLCIIGSTTSVKVPLTVRFATNLTVDNFTSNKSKSYQLYVDRCKDVTINAGSTLNNSTELDDDYGIIIGNSTDVTIYGGSHYATRHAIALGGDDVVCGIPNRNIRIIGASLYSAHDSDAGAADAHGNCDNVQYIDCTINSASVMNGRDVKLQNCTIFGRSAADGNAVYGSEIVGGVFEVTDCTIISNGTFSPFGCIQPSMIIPTKEAFTLKIKNLTVRAGYAVNGHIVRMRVAEGQAEKVNVIIDGIDASSMTALLSFLYVRCESNVSQSTPSNGMVVDNVVGPAGAYLIYPTGASMNGVKTKEMLQTISADVVTTVSQTAVSSPVDLRYKYSKLPLISVSSSTPTGVAFSFPGSYQGIPYVYSFGADNVRLAIASSYGNFTAGNTVRIHAYVGISEV